MKIELTQGKYHFSVHMDTQCKTVKMAALLVLHEPDALLLFEAGCCRTLLANIMQKAGQEDDSICENQNGILLCSCPPEPNGNNVRRPL
jgi:hypothetical protein